MCDAFKKAYPELTVTDMDKAISGKTAIEVNKLFAKLVTGTICFDKIVVDLEDDI